MSSEKKEAPPKEEVPEKVRQTVQRLARLLQEDGVVIMDVKPRALLVQVEGQKLMIGVAACK